MEELNLDQLEVGEWYEVKPSSGWKGWLHKHASEEDGCAIGSIVSTGEYCDKSVDYKWGPGYTFRKATKEQLKSFLPKDHPDYPIENSDYKWLLILQENIDCTDFEKGAIAEIDRLNGNSFRMKRFGYDIMLSGLAEDKIKPFLTKEDAEKYWDSINVKPVEVPKTKQLSDLKKGDWVKHISPSNTNFILNHLYKLDRDWDNQKALILNAQNRGDGYSTNNANNFTVPTQQEIDAWEKSLIKDEPKELVLPEKWCIKATEKNVHILKQTTHCNKHLNYNYTIGGYYGTKFGGDNVVPNGYTEITFEQFEKYVLKSKVIEDKPKEDMKTIPKYWYIENKYQEVRDYLADTYNESCIKNWTFDFIGWDESPCHKGCHGFRSADGYVEKATKITIEQFREYFLKKPKEVSQDDYSWWSELEVGDVIESLTDLPYARKKGDIFTILDVEPVGVSYREDHRSCKKEEWKLVSKAKDTKKNAIEEKLNLNEFPAQNLAQQQREILTFQKKCEVFHTFIPQPEETEIVPISKYFKIRN